MTRKLKAFSGLLSLFALLYSVGLHGAPEQSHLSSRAVFHDLMSEPSINKAYWRLQWRLLNYEDNRLMFNFFFQHPLMRPLFLTLMNNQDATLRDFYVRSLGSMTRLEMGFTPKFDKLIGMCKATAIDLGFSKTAVENMTIFLAEGNGVKNAFTVSGNMEQIIIVFHSDLIEKMDIEEVRAVVAHEMGHIRSSHSITRMLHQMLLNVLAQHVLAAHGASGNGEHGFAFKIKPFAPLHMVPKVMEIFEEMNSEMDPAQAVFAQLAQMPTPVRLQLLSDYLVNVQQLLAYNNAPDTTQKFFAVVRANLENYDVQKLDPRVYEFHANTLMTAATRSDENSADAYALALSANNDVASAFANLMGIGVDKEHRAAIARGHLKQAEDFYALVKSKDGRLPWDLLGTTHPFPILRITESMRSSSFPFVIFAHPFLRLLLLERGIWERDLLLKEVVDSMQTNPHNLPEEQFKNGMEELNGEIKANRANRETVILKIIQLVREMGVNNAINPRLDNLIEYYLTMRQLALMNIVALNEEMKKTAEQARPMYEILLKSQTQYLELQQPVIKVLKADLSKSQEAPSVRRLALLNMAESEMDLDKLSAARSVEAQARVQQENSRGAAMRLPLELTAADCRRLLAH